ncbi:MAG: hypothetical protein IMZ64_05080 [Bacteroidetes bacterium]|nr:hypothetical protein [Bacteroidota bacterium]
MPDSLLPTELRKKRYNKAASTELKPLKRIKSSSPDVVPMPEIRLDANDKKRQKLQEFLSARGSSSEDIKQKFCISPKCMTKAIFLKDGRFFYSMEDIATMLMSFSSVAEWTCGSRK